MALAPPPQELLDAIVDELRCDLPSLATCCAASRLLRSRACKHLFRDVTFHPKSYQSLYRLVQSSRDIPEFILVLRIHGGEFTGDQWARDLAILLKMLINVKELRVQSMLWGYFLAEQYPTLHHTLISMPITSLYLDRVCFASSVELFSVISQFRSLKQLSLGTFIQSYSVSQLPFPSPVIPPKLCELSMDMENSTGIVQSLLNQPHPLIYLQGIKVLKIHGCSNYDVGTVRSIMTGCPSLEHLIFGQSYLCTSFKRTFLFQFDQSAAMTLAGRIQTLDVSYLKYLTVTILDCSTQLQWWVDMFLILQCECRIQVVTIVVEMKVWGYSPGCAAFFQAARWRAFDRALTLPAMGFLRKVVVKLCALDYSVSGDLLKPFEATIHNSCSVLKERGLLQVVESFFASNPSFRINIGPKEIC
ncbi:uncharacterized protein BT62DRAFT_1009036 [Guyanagaster necrorhizus]|uniref:F-box domain-containing protein n=1 Tax=Guyanagaster necrorhizus TaxID=856835 RepID=A0A9P7VPJ6_9AGAR|nr:uncharacterized protein BT62DRAFT_1009036 [Guyanagaster necrorhizus MCA 3950]KAG7443681.1 hypothetical protein BT62DRAFT_1009036 [Guyanagaster necrorhizus MCA 3950]